MTKQEFIDKWIKYFQSEGIFIDKMSGPNEEHRQFEIDLEDMVLEENERSYEEGYWTAY